MKKILFLIDLVIALNYSVMAQVDLTYETPYDIIKCLDEVGKDTLLTLNECESKCLNYKFQKMRGSFDFNGKKVLFFRGNTGKVQVSKKWYFDVLKKSFEMSGRIDYEYVFTDWLFFFCAEEARLVGCDAVVFIACKKAPLSKQEVLKRIGCSYNDQRQMASLLHRCYIEHFEQRFYPILQNQ